MGALALTLGVAFHGDLSGTRPVTVIGVVGSVAIGIAMALRAREAIRTAERAYARLDRALAEAEHSRDQLVLANDELQRANVQMKAMQIALADALNLADERSHGRMRELIEETGEELAEILEEHMARRGTS
jgi:biopolymer transport protein ExbB/TolQ